MIRGLYTAASGMVSQLINQDIVANNIANVNTVGFKRTGASFQSFGNLLLDKKLGAQSQAVGQLASQNKLYQSSFDWSPGSVQQTGNTLDVAIQGDGFFHVKGDDGQSYYTRNGAFRLSGDGTLVTQDGKTLQSDGGPIQIPPEAQAIQIDKSGQVSVNGQPVGRIQLVSFANPQAMQAAGSNLYTTQQPEQPADKSTLIQGAIERTNVNVVSELLHNMSGLRAYETLQKTFQAHSDLLKKAVTEVGRIR
jgi:flagellar basal-body rod protein FlgF